MLEDDAIVSATDAQIKSIGALAQQALVLQAEIEALELTMKTAQAELRQILENGLPEAMDAAQCGTFTTPAGRKITVAPKITANIPKARQEEAFAWLRANGFEDLIKHELKVTLGRGKDNVASEIVHTLSKEWGLEADNKTTVHTQTLSAFCREQIALGKELPADILGLYSARIATIK